MRAALSRPRSRGSNRLRRGRECRRPSDMRCTPLAETATPCFAEMVRELTPIQPISDDRRPYSIFGQRFITTLMPAASALAAASSWRTPSCIQITAGRGCIASTSSTIGGTCGDGAENIDHVHRLGNVGKPREDGLAQQRPCRHGRD